MTYAAPWRGYHLPRPADGETPGLRTVDVERAQGRRRLAAHCSARAALRELAPEHDLVLIHDPELLPLTVGLRLPPVVWDVHEDLAGVSAIRPWLPDLARRPAKALATWLERRFTLLLADRHYAARFRQAGHAVIPNTTPVPADPPPAGARDARGGLRVVYRGSVAPERGAAELVELGARLRQVTGGTVQLEVVGPAHGAARTLMTGADDRGDLIWAGFVPAPQALARLDATSIAPWPSCRSGRPTRRRLPRWDAAATPWPSGSWTGAPTSGSSSRSFTRPRAAAADCGAGQGRAGGRSRLA